MSIALILVKVNGYLRNGYTLNGRSQIISEANDASGRRFNLR